MPSQLCLPNTSATFYKNVTTNCYYILFLQIGTTNQSTISGFSDLFTFFSLGISQRRGGTWRERVTRTRTRITLILYNFPESSTFCEIFTFKFRSVYADCQRLREIVQDSAINFYFSESCQPSCNVKRRRRRLPVFVKILCIYLWN